MADGVTVRLTSGVFDDGSEELRTVGDEFDVSKATADEHDELEPVSADNSGGSDDENTPADDSNESLTDLSGVGESTADDLRAAGYESVADVRSADADQLADDVDGIGQSLAESLTGTGEE